MSNRPQIKYVAISGVSGLKIITTCGNNPSRDDTYKSESKNILDKLQDVYLKAGERQKIRTSNGSWFSTCDTKDIFYLVLTDKDFPERQAYSMVADLIRELKGLGDYDNASEELIHEHIKRLLPGLLDKYNGGEGNLISAVQEKANHIKEVMADTIHRAIENKETMEDLDRKSANLNTMAQGFHDSSHNLNMKMKKQSRRRMMIYGCIALFVILFLYLLFR